MYKLIGLLSIQSIVLMVAQLMLKMAVKQFGPFQWTWPYFKSVLFCPYLIFSGICALGGTCIWIFVLKKYEFSLAYPLTSLSYVFGLFAAQWVLQETVPATRWIGVVFIIVGVYFVAK